MAGSWVATRAPGLRGFLSVLIALPVVAALSWAAVSLAHSGSTAARAGTPAHRTGWGNVPVSARGPISAALGAGQPSYRVLARAGRLVAVSKGRRLRASFGRGGVSVRSGGSYLGLRLAGLGYGSALAPVAAVAPRAHANRVTYPHPGVDEWFANGPLGLEQGFTLSRAPVGRLRGPLTLSLATSSNLRAALSSRGKALVLKRNGRAVLAYRGLVANDARGRTLRSWLQLQGGRLLIRVDARNAVYPVRVDPFIVQGELTASDGQPGDQLGYSVAVSGDGSTVVAGSCGCGGGAGAAYVFTKPGGGWSSGTEAAKLTASDGQSGDSLGSSVAISTDGTTIVAGAPSATVGSNPAQGAAYVFTEPGGGWANENETAKLTASDGQADDDLGFAVATSSDGSTVTAGECGCASGTGAAYVFAEPGGGWTSGTETAKLTASDGQIGDQLGSALAISGDGSTLVAGAPFATIGGNTFQGAAYVFIKPVGGWTNENETAKLTASDGAADDGLGFSVTVSADGSTVAAGAPTATVNGNSAQGAAYVYTKPGGGWSTATETAKLTASDGLDGDWLGNSVALSGDGSSLIAGAPFATVGLNPGQGAAYQFTEPGGGWSSGTETAKLTAADGLPADLLGFSVAISLDGSTIVTGMPNAAAGDGQADVFGPSTLNFESQRTFPTDAAPLGIATGDFNGDGIPDLVTANEAGDDVSVLIGNGDGTFVTPAPTYPVGGLAFAVAVGDFNGDGKLDLVVVNQGDDDVSILLGNGDGTFQSQQPYAVGAQPTSVAVGDLNGDGVPDLAVANGSDDTVSILLGKGDGTFQTPTTEAVGSQPDSVAVADFNGDGKQDLVTANCCDNNVSVLLGNGNGTFQAQQTYDAGDSPYAVAVGDFNNDGIPDLAVTNDDSTGGSLGSVAVLLGSGDGSFGPFHDYATGGVPQSLAVGDFDGDGNQDLAVGNLQTNNVGVLLGDGDGSFQTQEAFATGAGPASVAVSDFDRDGKPDIAVPNLFDNTASVLINSTSPFTSAAIRVTGSTVGAGSVLIDEMRLSGPSGSSDQLVDLFNTSSSAVSVGGWQLQTSGGGFTTIPLGTTIPASGNLLLTGPGSSYSLSSYATSNGELPSGPLLEPASGGLRLVAPSGSVIDKVGFAGAPSGFYAGTGLSVPPSLPSGQFGWVRNVSSGAPVNTNDNASDFSFVSTNDLEPANGSPVLGAPGPGNLVSPIVHNDVLQSSLLDPSVSQSSAPNRIYSAGSPGTLIVNRVFTNCSGQTPTPGTPCANVPAGTAAKTVTRLRFRITGVTTVNSPGAGSRQAVLKADTSTGETGLAPAPCSGTTDVVGLPLDSPSVSGSGGLNATWTATAELPSGGLAPGECINVEFEFDVTQTGQFNFAYNAEDDLVPASSGLPGGSLGGGSTGSGTPGGTSSGQSAQGSAGSGSAPGGSSTGGGAVQPTVCVKTARDPFARLGPPVSNIVIGTLGATSTRGCGTPRVPRPAPRRKGSISLHPRRVRGGHRVRVTGTIGRSCRASARVTIASRAFSRGPRPSAKRAHASRAGVFSMWVLVPQRRKLGTYLITASCGGHRFATAKLHVIR